MLNLAITLLALASTTFAAPMQTLTNGAGQYGAGGGIVGFIVLVLDIIVWSTCTSIIPTISHTVSYRRR